MNHMSLYLARDPDWLEPFLEAPSLQRLKHVGMNCGCEYTSFPLFHALRPYSRFDHSLGVAKIIYHFTEDPAQSLSGLFHDIATPVFAHVVDFLHGDYLTQESTEQDTEKRIREDPVIDQLLQDMHLDVQAVSDAMRYPAADLPSPRLCADRLEYTIGNSLNYGFATPDAITHLYDDLRFSALPDGSMEIMFQGEMEARLFGYLALRCGQIYVSDPDRYAMQVLSELLADALKEGVLQPGDLMRTEPEVIARLRSSGLSGRWEEFCALSRILRAERPRLDGPWRRVSAKRRYIDPYIQGRGRLSAVCPDFARELQAFLAVSQDVWLCGS